MAFIELIRTGHHTIINESAVQAIFRASHTTLANNDYKLLPSIVDGGYVLVVECVHGNAYFSYQKEMECVEAYEKLKAGLNPTVFML